MRTLIDLAKRLKLMTVAEWVKTKQAARTLEAWGCDYLQGALMGLASVERPWLVARARPCEAINIGIGPIERLDTTLLRRPYR